MVTRYDCHLQVEVIEVITGHVIPLAFGHGLLPMASVLQSEAHSADLLRTFLIRAVVIKCTHTLQNDCYNQIS